MARAPTSPRIPGAEPADTPRPVPRLPFEQSAALVLGDLQHAVADLLGAAPGEVRKAADVEKALGVNHLLGWQLWRIATADHPLAAGMHVPARVSVEKLVAAARKRGVNVAILDRLLEAFEAFERLVVEDAGDREALDVLLAAFVPELARKQDLAARQAAFRAASQIRGLAAEADVAAMFFHLSADGGAVDRVTLNGQLGLRRTRPDASIIIGSGDSSASLPSPVLTLDGRPCSGPFGALLPQFSTSPMPEVEAHELGGMTYYRLAGSDVGLRAAVDLVIADRRSGALPRWRAADRPRTGGPSYAAEQPVKRATLDVFVHRAVFPGVTPRLWVYDISARGPVSTFDDPRRVLDRVNTHEALRALPGPLAGARLPHAPRYVEMLEHVHRVMGWDPGEFRAWRLDVSYPVAGMQYMVGFDLPEPPATGS